MKFLKTDEDIFVDYHLLSSKFEDTHIKVRKPRLYS